MPAKLLVVTLEVVFANMFVAPTCHAIYPYDQCVIKPLNGQASSKCCNFVRFPNHPHAKHRNPCDTVLMKKVKSSTSNVILYPKLIYCYKSITKSLQEMFFRSDFSTKCEAWRTRICQDTAIYCDVYDGGIWKDFQVPNGVPFLSLPNNLTLQVNVDWFNPFSHTQHSEGVIYITVMNLPRQDRFLQENYILVGVIPGSKEPSLHINSFLKPTSR